AWLPVAKSPGEGWSSILAIMRATRSCDGNGSAEGVAVTVSVTVAVSVGSAGSGWSVQAVSPRAAMATNMGIRFIVQLAPFRWLLAKFLWRCQFEFRVRWSPRRPGHYSG